MVAYRDLDAEIAAWEQEVERRNSQPERSRFDTGALQRAREKLRALLAERDRLGIRQ